MHLKLLLLALVFQPVLLAETAPARPSVPAKAKAPTLEDVIFDARYLKQVLPPQTIFSPIENITPTPLEITDARKALHLDDTHRLSPLPAGAVPLKRDKIGPPHFPDERRHSGIPGKVSFLLYVGADGKVIGLYCYEATDHVYAVAAAEALLVWKFKPAKIDGKPIPVLATQLMEFNPG